MSARFKKRTSVAFSLKHKSAGDDKTSVSLYMTVYIYNDVANPRCIAHRIKVIAAARLRCRLRLQTYSEADTRCVILRDSLNKCSAVYRGWNETILKKKRSGPLNIRRSFSASSVIVGAKYEIGYRTMFYASLSLSSASLSAFVCFFVRFRLLLCPISSTSLSVVSHVSSSEPFA